MALGAWLVLANLWSSGFELDSLQLSVFYDVVVPTKTGSVVWPGPGLDIGVDPWHLRYAYQGRFFGDGLQGDEVFLEGEAPRLEKYRHRLTTSWEKWEGIVRFEVGAGWAWSHMDVFDARLDPREIEQAHPSSKPRSVDPESANLYWFRVRQDRFSDPVGFLGFGVGRRERWMFGVQAEYWRELMLGLHLQLRLF